MDSIFTTASHSNLEILRVYECSDMLRWCFAPPSWDNGRCGGGGDDMMLAPKFVNKLNKHDQLGTMGPATWPKLPRSSKLCCHCHSMKVVKMLDSASICHEWPRRVSALVPEQQKNTWTIAMNRFIILKL